LSAGSPFESEPPGVGSSGIFPSLWRSHTGTAVRLVLTLAALLALARTYLFTYRYFVAPVWLDFWFWPGDFQRWVEHRFTLHDLIKPLGEHRIVTTRPLLLVDSLFFDMNGRTLIAANLVLLFALGLMLARLVRQGQSANGTWNWPPLFWAALIGAVCQYENLLIPMDVGVALTCAATCASALLLMEATYAAGAARAATLAGGAALMAVAAVFSMASGVLAMPALLLMLVLRRARPAVWAVFAPILLLGVASFFFHYPSVHDLNLHPLDPRLAVMRILYVGNFLGSAFFAFSKYAAPVGLAGLLLFLVAAAALARRYALKGKPVPGGDAALVALCVFVALGGPVGSLSPRIFLGGAEAALVSRYATYSLLFVIAVLGLYVRWAARELGGGWFGRVGFPVAGLALLALVNVPYHSDRGATLRQAVMLDAQLLRNNVAAEGPTPWYPGASIADIRDAAVFLHARKLNIFSPAAGPPPSMLASLSAMGDMAALPACRGYIDQTYAIDSTAFLLAGWVADSDGRKSAPWVAVVDGSGKLLGTASSLITRTDVRDSLRMTGPAYGFEAGFRLAVSADPGTQAPVQVLGLFVDGPQPICRLPAPAVPGPILIEPAAALSDLVAAPVEPEVQGLEPWRKNAGRLTKGPPGDGLAWEFVPVEHRGGRPVLRFRLNAAPDTGRALAVPFAVTEDSPGYRMIFTFGDGARLETDLPSIWNRSKWHAAVVPPEQLAKHGGQVTVEIQAAGDAWFAIGAPLRVTLQPEWSRLF
jgi:hypothetical protein